MTGEPTTPTLGPAMWGSVGIQSGGIAVINAATFQYGGGAVNTQHFTMPSQSVLAFITDDIAVQPARRLRSTTSGSHVYITNNNFFHNFDAAMQIEPNGLLAGDPLTPLRVGPSVLPRQRDAGQRHRRHGRRDEPRLSRSTPNYNNYIGPDRGDRRPAASTSTRRSTPSGTRPT